MAAELQVKIRKAVMQTDTKKTKNMTALSIETAIINSVPSTIANPSIVKRKLYSTNEENSTMGNAESPMKTAINKVAIGYSMTKDKTGANILPRFVSFHL